MTDKAVPSEAADHNDVSPKALVKTSFECCLSRMPAPKGEPASGDSTSATRLEKCSPGSRARMYRSLELHAFP